MQIQANNPLVQAQNKLNAVKKQATQAKSALQQPKKDEVKFSNAPKFGGCCG